MKETIRRLRDNRSLNPLLTALARRVTPPGSVVRQSVRRHLPVRGLVERRLPNGGVLRLWTDGDESIASTVFWGAWDSHEPETSGVFFDLARDCRVVIDVGAHVGYHSLLASHANPGAVCFAFEPLPSNYRRLDINRALNGVGDIRAVQSAVGSHNHTATIRIPQSARPGVGRIGGVGAGEGWDELEVPVVTLDGSIDDAYRGEVDLLKIDVEGMEPDVLSGAREIVAASRPLIVCEVLNREADERVRSALAAHRYSFLRFTARGLIPQERPHDRVKGAPEMNYLAVPTEDANRVGQHGVRRRT